MSHDADTPEEFNALLSKADRSLVDFHATWCGPCKAIAPYVVEQSAKQGVNLIKVDVDKNAEIAQKYGISAMPTFKVISRSGDVIFEKVGGGQANVNACIEKVKSG
jgi:thioredoxin 1